MKFGVFVGSGLAPGIKSHRAQDKSADDHPWSPLVILAEPCDSGAKKPGPMPRIRSGRRGRKPDGSRVRPRRREGARDDRYF